jgi:hypothetical protein
MMVELGPLLCAFDMPVIVGRGVELAARFDDCQTPVFQHRRDRWLLFAACREPVAALDEDELRQADVTITQKGWLQLPVPGTDRDWLRHPHLDVPIPSQVALTTHVLAMRPPMLHELLAGEVSPECAQVSTRPPGQRMR